MKGSYITDEILESLIQAGKAAEKELKSRPAKFIQVLEPTPQRVSYSIVITNAGIHSIHGRHIYDDIMSETGRALTSLWVSVNQDHDCVLVICKNEPDLWLAQKAVTNLFPYATVHQYGGVTNKGHKWWNKFI